jgi:catechol 2,3-dioxygenase-like lactoylglutathione lyase family enzyme
MATLRYLVHEVDAAVDFYVTHLGFALEQRWGRPSRSSRGTGFSFGSAVPAAPRRALFRMEGNRRRAGGTAW